MIARNLPELFYKQAEKNKDKVVFEYRLRRNEPYRKITWDRLTYIVKEIAYGLAELGINKGDKVCILSNTRYEWAACDLAISSCGAVVVPIYPTLGDEAVNYILNDAACEVIILEDKGQLQKIRAQWDKLPHIKYAIVIEDLGDIPQYDSRILTLKGLKDRGKLNFSKDMDFLEEKIKLIDTDEVTSIIYTSGTTGQPKGVMLTHRNILSVLSALPDVLELKSKDKLLSFLPLSHVFERVGGLHYALSVGCSISYCSGIEQIGPSLRDSGATVMLVVPRLLEKIHSKIYSNLKAFSVSKKILFNFALFIGKRYFYYKFQYKGLYLDKPIICLLHFFVDKLILSAFRKKLAPGLKYFVSGGAPLSKEIGEFFCAIGIPVLEGYGLTETSAPATVNGLNQIKLGTVGKALPNVDIKIADDGEIIIKGDSIFLGYYNNKAATEEAFESEWFKTGDIGTIDEDGFLKITDRKKDIIVNSSGKKIAPQNLENAIKTSPYISNIAVVGDKKKYMSALVTLDYSVIVDYANQNGIEFNGKVQELSKNPKIISLIEEEINSRTANYADFEQIRRFKILPNDFTVESAELTPTLKIKRKFIENKYKNLIQEMYPND